MYKKIVARFAVFLILSQPFIGSLTAFANTSGRNEQAEVTDTVKEEIQEEQENVTENKETDSSSADPKLEVPKEAPINDNARAKASPNVFDGTQLETLTIDQDGKIYYKGEVLYVGANEEKIPANLNQLMKKGIPQKLTLKSGKALVGIQYNGQVSYGGTTVGAFSVNGKTAFCMQHPKPTPATGTQGELSPYENDNIKRIMYYGWEGPENIFGSDRERGIVVTSLVLSKYYNGDVSGTSIPGWAELDNLAQNGSLPKHGITIDGSNTTVNLRVSLINGVQVSESKSLIADPSNYINPVIPQGITLVNETTGTNTSSGTARINGGDKFHLEASVKTTYNYNSGVHNGVMKAFQPLVVRPTDSGLQDIGTWQWYDDPSQVVSFKADFFARTGDLKITKRDKGTGQVVPNTEFTVDYDGKSQTVKTDGKGEALVKDILHDTKITVTETFVPAPYFLGVDNKKEVVIQAGEVTAIEFQNERATGKTTLTKQDKTTESNEPLNPTYPLAGAKYGLFKSDGTRLKEFELDETLTATMDKLELNTYYWQETVAPVGHVLDPTKHVVELTYKDQYTPVVIQDVTSRDDVIRMNMDGQKLIQNATNEIFKNGVEFTLTNKRTEETQVSTTSTVDGKKGYFSFFDLSIDNYVLTETKGVEGYENIDPMEITHSYDKETGMFTFTVKDQKSGNVLNEEKITQLELSDGQNVDLGTYTLKDKAKPIEEPYVEIFTQAHIGDDQTQSFVWGEEVELYDNVTITHKNIVEGTNRAFETILVAVYTDAEGEETEKEVWTSGKIDYEVSDKELTEKVVAEYDYKQDPEGTRYYFKELGYNKPTEEEYVPDAEHNLDGKEKTQDITPSVNEPVIGISTQAHTGDDKTQTFTWGEDIQFYDNVTITHENIKEGTNRAYETILVAVYKDKEGKETEKDVWTSGKVDYQVSDKEITEKVLADYDYKKDPEGTRYYFKELGYNKPTEEEYVPDVDHNLEGKEKTQDLTPIVKEPSIVDKVVDKVFPQTGEEQLLYVTTLGVTCILFYVGIRYREQIQFRFRRWKRQLKQ